MTTIGITKNHFKNALTYPSIKKANQPKSPLNFFRKIIEDKSLKKQAAQNTVIQGQVHCSAVLFF